MFAKKLVFIAAAVALALTQVVAVEEANHVKIHVSYNAHHKQVLTVKAADSKAGSVAEDAEVGEDEDDEEEEDSEEDDEETEAVGSGSGAKNEAAVVAPVKPAVPASASGSAACTGKDESPTSVEGVAGIFCVTGKPCVADVMGACPGNSTELPLGSICGKVKSGVLGCIQNTKSTNPAKVKREAQHLVEQLDSKFFLKKYNAEHKKKTAVKAKSHKKH